MITPNFNSAGTSVLDRMLFVIKFVSRVRTLLMIRDANLMCSAVMLNGSAAFLLCRLDRLVLLSDDGWRPRLWSCRTSSGAGASASGVCHIHHRLHVVGALSAWQSMHTS